MILNIKIMKVALFSASFGAVLFITPLLAFGQTVTIDNDIPQGTLGHWSVVMQTGGESHLAFITASRARGDIFTEDVLFDYFSYVDIGTHTPAFQLSGSAPAVIDPNNPDMVVSTGSFTGANGNTIQWKVTSAIPDNGKVMTNKIEFRTADGSALGKLRFFQYLDEDIESVSDDVFFTIGTAAGKNLELFTLDSGEEYGVSHSGAFDIPTGLRNSLYMGWAADHYDSMKPRIVNHTQQVSTAGIIGNLSTFNHPNLGTVFGPADIVSVIAWDVDPNQSEAAVITTLGGVPEASNIFVPSLIDPPGARSLQTDNLIGDIDSGKPTVILTHGLQFTDTDTANIWTAFGANQAGRLAADLLGDDVNVLQYRWEEADQVRGVPDRDEYIKARRNVYDAGERLARLLKEELGPNYSQPIHFVGHSLGTAVNAYAARNLLGSLPIARAQFTILDYPNHIADRNIFGGIDRLTQEEENLYGFDSDFFTTLLPLQRNDLTLKIDNYFASQDVQSSSAVGDIVSGPVYNHNYNPSNPPSGLVNPNDLDDEIMGNETFDNDHSGVHQWYRWTMRPNNPFPDGPDDVCTVSSIDRANWPSGFHDSLNPCQRGWYWSVNNPDVLGNEVRWRLRFPTNNGGRVNVNTSQALNLEEQITVGDCSVEGSAQSLGVRCRESSSPYVVFNTTIPNDARYLSFDYRVTALGDGDYFAVLLDNTPIWLLSGGSAVAGQWTSTGPIPISAFAGERRLTIALYGMGEPNAEFEINNFQTFGTEMIMDTVDPRIVGYWNFDEGIGNIANDSTQNSNHGGINGATWSPDSPDTSESSLLFGPGHNYVSVPDSSFLDLAESFTISAWIKPTSPYDQVQTIFVKGAYEPGGRNYSLAINYGWSLSNVWAQIANCNFPNNNLATLSKPIKLNEWQNIVFRYRAETKTRDIFLDSELVSSNTAAICTPLTNTQPLYLGGVPASPWSGFSKFTGGMDNVMIYHSALSDEEIAGMLR